MTLKDGLTRREAEAFIKATLRTEHRLRTEFDSKGNYVQGSVRMEESYRRGHTLDSREDCIRYRVIAEPVHLSFSDDTQFVA